MHRQAGSRQCSALRSLSAGLSSIRSFLLPAVLLAVTTPGIRAQDAQTPPTLTAHDVYTPSFQALFTLFILAVLLESGLAIIFNWKLFISTFDAKATKPLIAVLVASLFVFRYKLDIVTRLVNIYTNAGYPINFAGKFLTALVIAGGSAGVNRLLQALGFRSVQTESQPPPRVPPAVAWISVTLKRVKAEGMVNVLARPDGNFSLIGTISGPGLANPLLRFFFQDRARFPGSGGHTLVPGTWAIQLEGVDRNGAVIQSRLWGPYAIAAGTIIDIELTL